MIAVGPGAPNRDGKLIPVSFAVGDKVVLPGFGGIGLKVGEEVSCLGSFRALSLVLHLSL